MTSFVLHLHELNTFPGSEAAWPYAKLGLPFLPTPASPEQFSLCKLLADRCDEAHECMASVKSANFAAKLPTRLLDLGENDSRSVRLIESNPGTSGTGRYIALSHRWGDLNSSQRVCTYVDNIEQRKAHIPLAELPASFKDAMCVTRALGVRYLWIDSLCIIQNCETDWAAEAGKMESVFSNAYCTIAASSAISSLVGFLGERDQRDVTRVPLLGGESLYLAKHIDNFRDDVENSVLSSRGWVFQERALSRRTIYFTSTQIYWECGNGIVCETLAQLRK